MPSCVPKEIRPVEAFRPNLLGGFTLPLPLPQPIVGIYLDHFFVSRARFARKYVYVLHGTLENTCFFATDARWCAKTLEKTRENHAGVHSNEMFYLFKIVDFSKCQQ